MCLVHCRYQRRIAVILVIAGDYIAALYAVLIRSVVTADYLDPVFMCIERHTIFLKIHTLSDFCLFFDYSDKQVA